MYIESETIVWQFNWPNSTANVVANKLVMWGGFFHAWPLIRHETNIHPFRAQSERIHTTRNYHFVIQIWQQTQHNRNKKNTKLWTKTREQELKLRSSYLLLRVIFFKFYFKLRSISMIVSKGLGSTILLAISCYFNDINWQ